MTLPFLHERVEDFHAWLHTAQAAIGGSDVNRIITGRGVDRVWDRIMGMGRDISHVPAIARGLALEPHALAKYNDEHEPVTAGGKFYDTERWYLRATPDGLLDAQEPHGVLEAKVLGSASYDDFVLRGPSPDYKWQMQHYLYVLRRTRGVFAILHPERWTLHTLEVTYDAQAYEQHVLPLLDTFWADHVMTRRRPTNTTTSAPALAATPTFVEAGDAWREAFIAFRDAKRAREEAEATEERWKSALKEMSAVTGQRRVLVRGVGQFTVTEGTRRTFDVARFAADHPQLNLDPWYKQSTTTTLRPTFNVEE